MSILKSVAVVSLALTATFGPSRVLAQKLTTIHSFNGSDGATPYAPLIAQGGLLYSTASCALYCTGTIYSIDPTTYSVSVLWNFANGGGSAPYAGLIYHNGSFYGGTFYGGAFNYGTAFQLKLANQKLRTIHSFSGYPDGSGESARLVYADGAVYGTTQTGGNGFNGTVFKIDLSTGAESVVYNFQGNNSINGGGPRAGLTRLGADLYGVTEFGGANEYGTIFKINLATGREKVLYSFTNGTDGCSPVTELIYQDGMFYGLASNLTATGYGTIFSFNPKTGTETTLYNFTGQLDGYSPISQGGLAYVNGVLYGTTESGGASGYGTVFKFDIAKGALTTLYSFANDANGGDPEAGLLYYNGMLYGTASRGGTYNEGTIFSIKP